MWSRRPRRRHRPPVRRRWRSPARRRHWRPIPVLNRCGNPRVIRQPWIRSGVGEGTPARRRAAASRSQPPPAAATGGPSPERAALELLQARLEGAHTAARLHAQRRHEERERYEAERVDLKSELEFLRERVVRAEEAEREMRLLMAQQ